MVYWSDLFLQLPPYSFSFFFFSFFENFSKNAKSSNSSSQDRKMGPQETYFHSLFSLPHLNCKMWGFAWNPYPSLPCLKYTNTLHRMPYLLSDPLPKIHSGDAQVYPTASAGTDVLRTCQCHGWKSNPEFHMKPYLLN